MSRRPVDMDYDFFNKMDLNTDGIVDKAEVEKIRKDNNDRIIDGILSIADVNGDGQLTYKEFKSHLSGGAQKLTPAEEQKNQAMQLLSFIDSDGDNKLSPLELYSFSQKTATNKVSSNTCLITKSMSSPDCRSPNPTSNRSLACLTRTVTDI